MEQQKKNTISLRLITVRGVSFGILILGLFFFLSIPSAAVLSITAHAAVNLAATAVDFDAGEKLSTNNTINWTADAGWVVEVKSLNANLGQSDDLSYTKPLSDLLWKLSIDSTWTPITTTDTTVENGGVGPGFGSFDMDYKFLLAWDTDKPGTYSTTVQYTITHQ